MTNKGKLYLDTETGPNIVYSWRIGYNINLSPENIIREREMICIAWKWENEDTVYAQHWDYKDKQRDKKLLKDFSKIYSQASEIVVQNGIEFDLKWLRTRILINKLPPLPHIKVYDTLKYNRRWFNFNSNKLDYVSKVLGSKGKTKMEYQDWIDVMNGSQKALDKMTHYCMDDVRELETVEQLSRKHIPERVSLKMLKYMNGICPDCKGKLVKNGPYPTNETVYQRWRCNDCGRHKYSVKKD